MPSPYEPEGPQGLGRSNLARRDRPRQVPFAVLRAGEANDEPSQEVLAGGRHISPSQMVAIELESRALIERQPIRATGALSTS
jgi:hypothetical protein